MKPELLRIAACRGIAPAGDPTVAATSPVRCPQAYADGHDHQACPECQRLGPPETLAHPFFPERGAASTVAKSVCSECPVRAACLVESLRGNESAGIFAGAGEQRRRVLRRAMQTDQLDEVVAAHWRDIDSCPNPGDRALLAASTGDQTHGKRATQAKGCTAGPDGTCCEPCRDAAAWDAQLKALTTPKRRKAA